ncbi:MAG: HAMP domain-containing sensor histidine kinase [Catonella sp.]|nr:HAMP domain-containing sensor histidine kinase [Catonella sp.]MDY6355778.1 HAMP domain-containing sensor histidine kinase [Catonella sp.]
MLKKLQKKFIVIAMTVVFVVMSAVLGLINAIYYSHVFNEANERLVMIANNSGDVPTKWDSTHFKNLTEDKFNKLVTPETRYETRYFTVIADTSGTVTDVNLGHIASIDEETATKYATEALSSDATTGIKYTEDGSSYMYVVTDEDDGGKRVTYLDTTARFSTTKVLFNLSTGIGLASYAVIFILVYVFSKRAIKPAIESSEKQKQFITNAGHELKTPLAIISANTEVLEMTEGKNEWTESTLAQVQRLSGLVNALISMSRMDEKNGKSQPVDTNVSKLTTETVNSFKSVISTQGKTLETKIEDDIHLNTNKDMLRELINILMDNAAKYCDDGGRISVILGRANKGKNVKFVVKNDYKDGSSVDCSKFFERFYRNDESHNSKKSGYGIGLSMAEGLTQALKGKISVAWKDGVIGFTVLL